MEVQQHVLFSIAVDLTFCHVYTSSDIPTGLIPFHSKSAILWHNYFGGNNERYISLQVPNVCVSF